MKRICLLMLLSACWLWSDDPEAQYMPAGAGKEIVSSVCTSCHGVDNIRRQRLSHDEWTDEVNDMVDRGAQADDDQMKTIVEYLTQNFGPKSKVLVNSAPMVEFKDVLELTADEAESIVAYRNSKGDFHGLDDMKKVPNLDWNKIEAKKDLLAF